MLLGSLTENIFGFTGTYARKQKASLAPILTGGKRLTELNTTSTEKIPQDGWLVNLRISGLISTNKVEKAVSWNVGPHGYQRGKKEIHKIFEQGPPINCLQDVRFPKRRKNSVKRELQRVFPHYWIYITTAQSSRKDCRDRPICIFGFDSTPLGLIPQSYTNALPSLQTDGPPTPAGK